MSFPHTNQLKGGVSHKKNMSSTRENRQRKKSLFANRPFFAFLFQKLIIFFATL